LTPFRLPPEPRNSAPTKWLCLPADAIENYQPQVVANEGSTDNRLYVVVEGSLAVIKQVGTPDESAAEHPEAPATLRTNWVSWTVRSVTRRCWPAAQARVLVLERQALESLITTHPMMLYRVMCAIVRTVHRIQTRLAVQASELTNYIVKQHGRY
jgi:CRP/FNR family cyclic AMP-dependent transcriptional regulator